jgi:hypothetical protein
MTFREVIPNGRGSGVHPPTDTAPSPSVHGPLVTVAADTPGESLRLDDDHATGTDEDVVNIPAPPR